MSWFYLKKFNQIKGNEKIYVPRLECHTHTRAANQSVTPRVDLEVEILSYLHYLGQGSARRLRQIEWRLTDVGLDDVFYIELTLDQIGTLAIALT